jgi:dTMP kinase
MNLAGKFIVIDGPDGSGKGTQLSHIDVELTGRGLTVCRARDPGGTTVGDRIRHILLDYDLAEMDPRCETLLFMASRAQLIAQVIRPALAAGQVVLCDRFISATCAYQGALGLPVPDIIALGQHAVGDTWPDLTIILDVPPEVGFQRTGRKAHHAANHQDVGQLNMFDGATSDAMERRPLDFHRRVRQIFTTLPKVYPRPVEIIDASAEPTDVTNHILEALDRAAQ